MDKYLIPPTMGLEMYINKSGTITLKQDDFVAQDTYYVMINLGDVETVRQALADLLAEALEADQEPDPTEA